MKRRSFIGMTLAGVAASAVAAPKQVPNKAQIAKWRNEYGAKHWDAAQGGFICQYKMVDCRDPENPVQYRLGDMMTWEMVAQRGLRKSVERIERGGKCLGRKIAYLTGLCKYE